MIRGNIQGRGAVGGNLTNGIGGGSTVSITPTLETGVKIADFEIDGESGELFAPSQPTYGILTDDIILWTNPTLTVASGIITLSDKLKNYDYFYFDYYSPNDSQNYTQCAQTPLYPIPKTNNTDFIHEGSWAVYPTYGNRSLDCYCDDLNSYNMYLFGSGQWDWPLILYRIHGVKHRIGVVA